MGEEVQTERHDYTSEGEGWRDAHPGFASVAQDRLRFHEQVERANGRQFLSELCRVLDVPEPEPTR